MGAFIALTLRFAYKKFGQLKINIEQKKQELEEFSKQYDYKFTDEEADLDSSLVTAKENNHFFNTHFKFYTGFYDIISIFAKAKATWKGHDVTIIKALEVRTHNLKSTMKPNKFLTFYIFNRKNWNLPVISLLNESYITSYKVSKSHGFYMGGDRDANVLLKYKPVVSEETLQNADTSKVRHIADMLPDECSVDDVVKLLEDKSQVAQLNIPTEIILKNFLYRVENDDSMAFLKDIPQAAVLGLLAIGCDGLELSGDYALFYKFDSVEFPADIENDLEIIKTVVSQL